jgi:hypothetical protein
MEASKRSKLTSLEVMARRLFTDLIRKGRTREEALQSVDELVKANNAIVIITDKEAIQLEREAKIVDLRDY